ncbi:MAG: DUF3127 domain-containing protein [Prevotella sp.]|nr:DUF3127 domain-containing protein [Prevotella sp.]
MEITGKIIAVLPPRSGVSARTGNPWMTQEYVIETHDQYPKKCLFNVFGEDKIKTFNIQVGDEMTVSFDIDAREYNGRYYNDIRAWAINRNVATPVAAGQEGMMPGATSTPFPPVSDTPFPPVADPMTAQPAASSEGSQDDLPF